MFSLELDHQVHARLGLDGIKLSGQFARRRRGRQFDALLQALDVDIEPVEPLASIAPVHIAQGDDVLACEVDEIGAAHAADSNAGNVQRIAWRSESAAENVSGNNGARSASSGNFGEKLAARHFFLLANRHFLKGFIIAYRRWRRKSRA